MLCDDLERGVGGGSRVGRDVQEGGDIWIHIADSPVVNHPAAQETWVPSLGLEDPLEEEMATYSSILD